MLDTSDTFIKICGMTRESDAAAALDLGAEAIGMLFYKNSPRFVSSDQAAGIARAVGDKGMKVGLFVDANADFVRDVLGAVPLDILQFHGSESQEYCMQFKRPYWKTLHVKEQGQLAGQIASHDAAAGILLDTWHPTQAGGTGLSFDWSVLDDLDCQQHLILAGGLNPENVAEAVSMVKPWAVDVSSGVEVRPGEKSEILMKQFIDEVKRASTKNS